MRAVLLFILAISSIAYAQVGINTTEPKAILDIDVDNDGVLFPRLTQSQIAALDSPEEGLMLYNLDSHCMQVYDGIQWRCLDFKTQTTSATTISSRQSITTHDLDNKLNEASGLIYLENGYFLIHNDGENILYKISENNPHQIVQEFHLPITIRDWEAITMSDEFVFIGDFGNNYGRQNVNKVYYFPVDELRREGSVIEIDNIEEFTFNYPEQTNFDTNVNQTDFDTEAFVYINEELHFFTKQWLSYGTSHYKIPFSQTMPSGIIDATFLENYDTQFLVTDASYKNSGSFHHLFLVGYDLRTGFAEFIQFTSVNKDAFFTNSTNYSELIGDLLAYGQVEAIGIKSYSNCQKAICVASEEIGLFNIPPKLTCLEYQ